MLCLHNGTIIPHYHAAIFLVDSLWQCTNNVLANCGRGALCLWEGTSVHGVQVWFPDAMVTEQ